MGDCKVNWLASQIQSLMKSQQDFPQKLKQRLVLESNKVTNHFKFIASLVTEGVLCDGSNDPGTYFGLKEMVVQLAIMVACSKGADTIGSLMEALETSGNTKVISALGTWVREDFTTEVDVVVSVADQQTEEEPVITDFFEQAAPSHELSKVATFNCQAGALSLEFDKNRMVAHLPDSTVKLWNWIEKEEKTTKVVDKVKLKPNEAITSFQYDEEIFVVGTSAGTIYLFDARTLEEKWSVRLGQPIDCLKFVESTIVIRTRGVRSEINEYDEHFWLVKVSRSKMQLLHPNVVRRQVYGYSSMFLVDPVYIFLCNSKNVGIYDTKSRGSLQDQCTGYQASFSSPAAINTFKLLDLIGLKRVLVAGCENGVIAIWQTSSVTWNQRAYKTFQGHTKAIVSLCAINEHLVSLDQSGKLLMWSGYDLNSVQIKQPIPRVLAENFHNVTCLVGCERWLASSSSKDGVINIWALPDSWCRAG